MTQHADDEDYEEEGDNTILWVLLGAAIVYFLMRQNASAAAPPSGSAPALLPPSSSGGMTPTFDTSNPPVPAVAPYSPGGNVTIPPNVSDLTIAEALMSPFGGYEE